MIKALVNKATMLGLIFVLLGLLLGLGGCNELEGQEGATAVCSDTGWVIITQADGSTSRARPMDDTMCPVHDYDDEGHWSCWWVEGSPITENGRVD